MLTLRTLKELIDTPKRGEKLPTPKQLRTGESPVVAHKTTGAGVNEYILSYISPGMRFMVSETEQRYFR